MDNKSHVVVTTFGTDRPGIVEAVSRWLLEHGGNIEESRMTRLGGEFATLILVGGAAGLADRLAASSAAFEAAEGLTVGLRQVDAVPGAPGASLLRYVLQATSLDHPGIVHQVSQLLARDGVNIVSAETRTTPAPFSCAPVFQFAMELDVPSTVSIPALRDRLNELARRDNIDVALTPKT